MRLTRVLAARVFTSILNYNAGTARISKLTAPPGDFAENQHDEDKKVT